MEDHVTAEQDAAMAPRAAPEQARTAPRADAPYADQPVIETTCLCCGGEMISQVAARFNRGMGWAFLLAGLFIAIFASVLIGLPLVLLGAYLGIATKPVWMCRTCGALVDRARRD